MATVTAEVPGSDAVSEDEEGNRELTRVFRVKCNSGEYGYSALRASGIPARYEAHPEDSQSFAYKGSAKAQSNERGYYLVTITYSNKPEHKDDVTQARPEVSWEDEEFENVADKDRHGTPILNKAGDRYEEPVSFTDSRPVLRVTRNESFFDQNRAYQYNRSTNSDSFYGADPGTMRVKITASQEWRDDVSYWKVTYLFRYNPDGWQPDVLEQGLYQLYDYLDMTVFPSATQTLKVPCTIKGKAPHDSEPVSYPVPIDEDGKQIDPELLPDAAIYTEHEVLEPLKYQNLGIVF